MGDVVWVKPRDPPSLRELEQLRVLAMYEFDPPLSSQELVGALGACDNRTQEAYNFLKSSRRRLSAASMPLSAPAMVGSSPEREREKRRMGQSADENDTPNPHKKHKALSLDLMDAEEKMEEDKEATPETQQHLEGPSAVDCARAQQLLLQIVEDRAAGVHPPRNPNWVNDVWTALQVPAELELGMQLNLTVDALARWVKLVEAQDPQEVQARGAALTVEVVASLPPRVDLDEAVACNPKDEVLSLQDEEVATKVQTLMDAGDKSAYDRAKAAKSAIECLSEACSAYKARLSWAAGANEQRCGYSGEVEMMLETLCQKLVRMVEKSSHDVKEGEQALLDSKQMKETRSLQIVNFVKERHEHLVSMGETEASASLQSVVEVWTSDDVEVQALWSSRNESEARVNSSALALKIANTALTFHQNLTILFRKVRERREEAIKHVSQTFNEVRTTSEARATSALEKYIPKLTGALLRYYEFHSIQQAKAKEEQAEQEKALEAHIEYFGDSAPIKKNDIEQRIREFIGVTQSSMQLIMEIADGQRALWEDKQVALPESVRRVLAREFKALWVQLSGPMRDVMSRFVSAIEAAAGGVVAVEPQQQSASVFVSANSSDERVIPLFTVPSFANNHVDVTPYRTAISAVVAPNEVKNSTSSGGAEKESDTELSVQKGTSSTTNEWVDVTAAGSDETRVASSPIQVPETHREFAVGSVVYSKMAVGESCTQFVRGVVEKQLENGMYLVQYDNNDKFSVGGSFLFTKDLMDQHLKAGTVVAPDHDTEMEDTEKTENRGRCSIIVDYALIEAPPHTNPHISSRARGAMSSRFSEESAEAAEFVEKLEQLQNELALAQYEAQKWKEKYLVEKRRRQKTARDLLDLVVRTERRPLGVSNRASDSVGAGAEDSSSLFSPDHTANLLSPTLSSFDFDDDSSEEESGDSSDQDVPGTPQPLVNETRNEAEVVDDSEDGKPQTIPTATRTNDRSDAFSPSLALDLRDRQSLMYHLNAAATIPGRASRSSTTGSALEAFGGSSRRLLDGKNGGDNEHSQQQQHLMYRIMYTKPSSRDLWNSRAHPNRLQNVARSIMFSMHLKKEHIFERFFVTGMVFSEAERQYQATQSPGLAGFWKPRVLYDFPNRANDPPDDSVADFCFPKGVPMTSCTPDQMASLQGSVVSKWFTEIGTLQNHVEQLSETSGYTFRLTGAKGEVLYGFCVAVLKEVNASEVSSGNGAAPKSPRSNWTPNWFSGNVSGKGTTMDGKIAPVCFCFTSKFPFYRFHFAVLRMIVENEVEQQRLSKLDSPTESGCISTDDNQFEVILRPNLDLAMDFTIYHEENPRLRTPSTDSDTGDHKNLNSIGAKLSVSQSERRVVLSEDASVGASESSESQPTTELRKRPSQIRKSLSTDAIGTYNFANEWIVDKPMVKSIDANRPKEYERVKVGDILEAVDSISTASLNFEQALTLLEKGNRPMRLRFRRPQTTAQVSSTSPSRPKKRRSLSPSSIDILHRARRIKVNDPGHWSTARFPMYDFSYQFPKRHSDRWSVGVVLRFLAPERVVEIMAFLLLEKQVVIMSDSPAKVSAICTALLLLLAPFQWQSTYIPLLPSGLLDFLHSPVPFLVGCHTVTDTSEWSDVCFYDIDKDQIAIPAVMRHLGPTSIPNGVELCRLIRKAKERFCVLRASSNPWYELTDEQDTIITLTMQEAEIFLRDLGFDISSHDLAASISGGQSFYDRLQEEVAKEVRNSIYEDYLDEFTQTQLFCQYYESLLQPDTQKANQ